MLRSRIIGWGGHLPARVMTNHEIARIVDTSDEWIRTRTGIRQRHIAAPGELTSDLAIGAARAALASAGVDADEVDLVVVATSTPDETFPATAVKVQRELGITRGAAFDLQAVCSGFVYAVSVTDSMLKTGQARCALVVGAETFSRILDWTDRSTCVLFGDGAGALLLRASEGDRGVLSTHLHADGRHQRVLYVDGGVSSTQTAGALRMVGQEVFRHAVAKLVEVTHEALAANHLTIADVNWIVPHQANQRILDAVARRLDVPEDRVINTVDHHANTSAASIPLALAEAAEDGRIKPGDLVILQAIGGGLTWGSALIRW